MRNIKYLCAFILVCMTSAIYCTECPKVETVKNFKLKKFMGKWYEIQKYPNKWEAEQKCITIEYEYNPNGTITVVNSVQIKFNNFSLGVSGVSLSIPNEADPAKLSIQKNSFGLKSEVWVLDTDYENYALMYTCIPLPISPTNFENAWILSRTTNLDQKIIDSLKAKLSDVKSPTHLFRPTEQTDCPNRNSTSV